MRESTLSLNYTVNAYCRHILTTSYRVKMQYYRSEIFQLLNYYHANGFISDDLYDHFRMRVHSAIVVSGFKGSETSFAFGCQESRTYKQIYSEY